VPARAGPSSWRGGVLHADRDGPVGVRAWMTRSLWRACSREAVRVGRRMAQVERERHEVAEERIRQARPADGGRGGAAAAQAQLRHGADRSIVVDELLCTCVRTTVFRSWAGHNDGVTVAQERVNPMSVV